MSSPPRSLSFPLLERQLIHPTPISNTTAVTQFEKHFPISPRGRRTGITSATASYAALVARKFVQQRKPSCKRRKRSQTLTHERWTPPTSPAASLRGRCADFRALSSIQVSATVGTQSQLSTSVYPPAHCSEQYTDQQVMVSLCPRLATAPRVRSPLNGVNILHYFSPN